MPRTHPVILDHLKGIRNAIDAGGFNFPIETQRRPQDANNRYVDPPFAMIRVFPSADEMTGPLNDSQADIVLRFSIMGVGTNEDMAISVTDRCRSVMQRENVTIANRRVQDIRLMVVSAGGPRDDDLPTPFFYNSDIYEILTTPS